MHKVHDNVIDLVVVDVKVFYFPVFICNLSLLGAGSQWGFDGISTCQTSPTLAVFPRNVRVSIVSLLLLCCGVSVAYCSVDEPTNWMIWATLALYAPFPILL